ncbi:MAG: hypothetical protein WCI22_06225 [Actinomycetota bacterium]
MRLVRHLLAGVVAAAAVTSIPVGSDAAPLAAPRVPVHVMPTLVHRPLVHRPASSDPITYHGGAVMTGKVKVYVVWYGSWTGGARSNRRTIVTDFMRHLDSPYWAINHTYTNAKGASVGAAPTLSTQIDDQGSVGTSQLSDAQIQQVVRNAVVARSLPRDTAGIYLVITSSAVTKQGFLTQYCGWHSHTTVQGSSLKFSFIGDPSGPKVRNCSPQTASPNGDVGADAMASTIAHELSETVTDPTMRGWYSARGEENADRCAWQYGKVFASGGGRANVHLGTRDYLVQTNWVNDASPHCAMS